jgi:hypothetical protein
MIDEKEMELTPGAARLIIGWGGVPKISRPDSFDQQAISVHTLYQNRTGRKIEFGLMG